VRRESIITKKVNIKEEVKMEGDEIVKTVFTEEVISETCPIVEPPKFQSEQPRRTRKGRRATIAPSKLDEEKTEPVKLVALTVPEEFTTSSWKPVTYEFGKKKVSIDLPHYLESSSGKLTYLLTQDNGEPAPEFVTIEHPQQSNDGNEREAPKIVLHKPNCHVDDDESGPGIYKLKLDIKDEETNAFDVHHLTIDAFVDFTLLKNEIDDKITFAIGYDKLSFNLPIYSVRSKDLTFSLQDAGNKSKPLPSFIHLDEKTH